MDDNNHDTSTSTSRSMLEPKGYALSGKIMLSAIIILFAVVVIMVCLHMYARWYILRARQRNVRRARRRTHLVFYIDSDSVASPSRNRNRGLEDSLIKTLPTFLFDDSRKEEEEEGECAVCLSEFLHGETGRTLPNCNHCFHVDCIDMWFHSHDTCPLCRAPVMPAHLPPPPPPPPRQEEDEEEEELAEMTRIQIGPSLSFGGRGKGKVIEVPPRCQSFSFTNSDDSGSSQGFRSLKRIFSRSPSPLPSPSPSVSRAELDVELGQLDPTTPPTHG